jgi:hypothetical protein
MGALGIAILAKESKLEEVFSFQITTLKFETKGRECPKCSNHCEIVSIFKNNELIDEWGNRCEKGLSSTKSEN